MNQRITDQPFATELRGCVQQRCGIKKQQQSTEPYLLPSARARVARVGCEASAIPRFGRNIKDGVEVTTLSAELMRQLAWNKGFGNQISHWLGRAVKRSSGCWASIAE